MAEAAGSGAQAADLEPSGQEQRRPPPALDVVSRCHGRGGRLVRHPDLGLQFARRTRKNGAPVFGRGFRCAELPGRTRPLAWCATWPSSSAPCGTYGAALQAPAAPDAVGPGNSVRTRARESDGRKAWAAQACSFGCRRFGRVLGGGCASTSRPALWSKRARNKTGWYVSLVAAATRSVPCRPRTATLGDACQLSTRSGARSRPAGRRRAARTLRPSCPAMVHSLRRRPRS